MRITPVISFRVNFTNMDLYSLSGKTSYREKSWSHETGCYNDRIAQKFDRYLGIRFAYGIWFDYEKY